MHWEILDQQRLAILPALASFRANGFYLAGGTALALHLGHRDSVDFDFFTPQAFDTARLFEQVRGCFADHGVIKVQDEERTLTVILDASIKLSFFGYNYPLLRPLVRSDHLDLADIADIGCMKLSAITGRAEMKDYVDLYFLLQRIRLSELLLLCAVKLPGLDRSLILKSLVYFEDVRPEPILFTKGHEVAFSEVQHFLRAQVAGTY